MPKPIPFGEWTPDQPDRASGANEARGVVSRNGYYAPMPSFLDFNGANVVTASACLGAFSSYDSASTGVIFYGDATKLYQVQSRVGVDVSKVGGYTVSSEKWWSFAQFGDYVVAVADNTAPQVFQVGVSSAFANLAGSPPQGTTIAAVSEFLMMGLNSTVYWSAFNDITDWVSDPATQAGNQTLRQEHGQIQQIVGGDYAAIFQERAIRRALYVGPPLIWDFGQDPVETRRGCIGPFAAVKWGRLIFFASDDGFYAFDGQESQAIGDGKVDQYFVANLNYSYRHLVTATIDTQRKAVVFGFPSGSGTRVTELLVFSIKDGRWSHDYDDLDFLFEIAPDPLTVDNFHTYETSDDLDTTNLDALNIDSNMWDDRRRIVSGFRTSNRRMATMTGTNRAAIVETAEFEAEPGRRSLITEVWPVAEATDSNMSASIGYRRALPGASVTYTTPAAMNRAGFCPARIDARFARARLQLTTGATWTRLEGVHLTSRVTGGR